MGLLNKKNNSSYQALIALLLLGWLATEAALAGKPAAFPVYQFPEFSLSMSAEDARAWAREHEFTETAAVEAGQEAWQRVFPNGYEQTIRFIPAAQGLQQLILTQNNVNGTGKTLARQIINRYGEPSLSEETNNGFRLTYPYEHTVPARRVFITGPYHLTMGLITERQLAAALRADSELLAAGTQTQAADADAAFISLEALPAWAKPAGAVLGGLLVLALLVALLPAGVGGPVRRWVRDLGEAGLGFIGNFSLTIVTLIVGVLLYPLLILSGCSAGVFAVEQGTNWWWGLPWIIGMVYAIRSDDEGGIRSLVLADVFFCIALLGPILQQGDFWGKFQAWTGL